MFDRAVTRLSELIHDVSLLGEAGQCAGTAKDQQVSPIRIASGRTISAVNARREFLRGTDFGQLECATWIFPDAL